MVPLIALAAAGFALGKLSRGRPFPRHRHMAQYPPIPLDAAKVDSFEGMVSNLTAWEYPMDFHKAICFELRINPRVYVLPPALKPLLMEHYFDDLADVDAYSDEIGNVLYFFQDEWSDKYRQWVVAHELFHQRQFYDVGNFGGRHWEDMSSKQLRTMFERGAVQYADKKIGSVIGLDFLAYSNDPPAPKKRSKKRTKK